MKINTSYAISAIALSAIVLWFLINSIGHEPVSTVATEANTSPLPTVVVEHHIAEDHARRLKLYGRTAPDREVYVKAKTAGLVVQTPLKEGQIIERGTLICRQDIDARKAVLDQSKAMLKSVEFDLKSTQTLVDKGYRSAIQLENITAQVDAAKANVKQAEIELNNINMRAPFRGVFTEQVAQSGDYLGPGQSCGKLVDMDPLIITAELTETQIGEIALGQSTDITLATGESFSGEIRLIATQANPSTRTFKIEIAAPNAEMTLKSGVTATVAIIAGENQAQRIPSSILTLNDEGVVGVRYLDGQDIVRFAQTETIDEDKGGIWVTGLPDDVRVIVQGQDFVAVGTQAEPRYAASEGQSR